ncbi:MAG: YdeI/OmpD-associated family protein [Chloroflexi bacterium]|nr:YdeI/OmpD-associated family protein [Chloroflexota bacterium]
MIPESRGNVVTQKGIRVPPDLSAVLQENAQARAAFEALRPSCQRRYADWITGAKRPETRARRTRRVVEMALEWKARHDSRSRNTRAA